MARDDLFAFLEDETIPILTSVTPRQGCVQVLRGLLQAGYEVHLITARSEFLRPVTEDWLHRYQVPYTALHMSPSLEEDYSKGERCDQLGVEFFVDDHYPNCIDTADRGVYTLLFHASHNKHFSCPPEITRVYNWREIAQHIAALTG